MNHEQRLKAQKEFAAFLSDEEQSFTRSVLAELDLAYRRCRIHMNAIITSRLALKGGFVDGQTAIYMLQETGAQIWVQPTPPSQNHDMTAGDES